MKIYFFKYLSRPILLIILLFPSILLRSNFLYAEYVLEEMQIDTSTKTEGDNSAIPTNPFEIVEMIRRQNSLNDATNPTDAIDDELESFNNLE